MIRSLQNALSTFLEYIPQLLGAILILIVGYIHSRPGLAGHKLRPRGQGCRA